MLFNAYESQLVIFGPEGHNRILSVPFMDGIIEKVSKKYSLLLYLQSQTYPGIVSRDYTQSEHDPFVFQLPSTSQGPLV